MWDARYGSPQAVNPASYTGAAYYTPADQGFGPEVRGEPVFISEPVVEGPTGGQPAEPAPYSVVEGTPAPALQPIPGSDPVIIGPPLTQQAEPVGPVSDPVFVSNPVVEAAPDDQS